MRRYWLAVTVVFVTGLATAQTFPTPSYFEHMFKRPAMPGSSGPALFRRAVAEMLTLTPGAVLPRERPRTQTEHRRRLRAQPLGGNVPPGPVPGRWPGYAGRGLGIGAGGRPMDRWLTPRRMWCESPIILGLGYFLIHRSPPARLGRQMCARANDAR